jgi:hypothetical protein
MERQEVHEITAVFFQLGETIKRHVFLYQILGSAHSRYKKLQIFCADDLNGTFGGKCIESIAKQRTERLGKRARAQSVRARDRAPANQRLY